MPIYAYKCQACGHAKDVLQKMSDPVLTDCPACGKSEFQKQVTAAGFQLKGSGWYVTDFRGGNSGEGKGAQEAQGTDGKSDGKPAETAGKAETKSDTSAGAGKGTSTGTGTGAGTSPAAPAASAAPSAGAPTASSSAPSSASSASSSGTSTASSA